MAAGDRTYSFQSDIFSMGLVSSLFRSEKLRGSDAIKLETFNYLRKRDNENEKAFQNLDGLISESARVEWSVVHKMLNYYPEQR